MHTPRPGAGALRARPGLSPAFQGPGASDLALLLRRAQQSRAKGQERAWTSPLWGQVAGLSDGTASREELLLCGCGCVSHGLCCQPRVTPRTGRAGRQQGGRKGCLGPPLGGGGCLRCPLARPWHVTAEGDLSSSHVCPTGRRPAEVCCLDLSRVPFFLERQHHCVIVSEVGICFQQRPGHG